MEKIKKNDVRKKICFVILHYMVVETTIQSIEHIRNNIDIDDYQIIVVDNASPDQSYDILFQNYKQEEKITIIHNSENKGFSGGNNVGICYVLNNFEYEFIVVMNNDAFLLETAFYHKIDKYYQRYGFSVAGPRIIDRYGVNNNPVAEDLPKEKNIYSQIKRSEKIVKLGKRKMLGIYFWYRDYRTRLERMNKIFRKKEKKEEPINSVKMNVVLHGSFWIFSPKYFEEYTGLANKKNMFVEEETLLYKLQRKNLLSIYMPDVLVLHLEDASTDAVFRKNLDKELFVNMQRVASWKEYLEMIRGNQ